VLPAPARRISGETEENKQSAIQLANDLRFELSNPNAYAASGYGRDPVYHQTAGLAQTVLRAWRDRES
jgi:hypothetical protein